MPTLPESAKEINGDAPLFNMDTLPIASKPIYDFNTPLLNNWIMPNVLPVLSASSNKGAPLELEIFTAAVPDNDSLMVSLY